MFASTLFADESDVRDFDLQIQNLLRIGQADEAAEILETALRTLGESSHPVVALCLACRVDAVEILGWDALAARIGELERPDAPIVALGVDLSWPGHTGLQPDENGVLEPQLETNCYTEPAFAFAGADRETLLRGYGRYGAEWQGAMADSDTLLTVRGLGELYGMVYPLAEAVMATPQPEALDADAMQLGAAFVAVRLHQAVARTIRLHGLPRPLAVIVGSNESYPYYDAPVFSTAESREFAPPVEAEAPEGNEAFAQVAKSDLAAPDQAESRQQDGPRETEPISFADHAERVVHLSGASLRHRISQQRASEQRGIETGSRQSGGLLRRLFAR